MDIVELSQGTSVCFCLASFEAKKSAHLDDQHGMVGLTALMSHVCTVSVQMPDVHLPFFINLESSVQCANVSQCGTQQKQNT